MKSRFLYLDRNDFFKGMIVAVICTFITGFYQVIAAGFTVNWLTMKPVVIAAIGSAVSYLTKNLLTNSRGQFMETEEKPETVKT